MDPKKPISTTQVPPQFLESAFLTGHIPITALTSDPRISYTLYIPPEHYHASASDSQRLNLLVSIHGTRRNISPIYSDDLVSFARSTPCAVLAPIFPAALDGPNDLDSYMYLRSGSVQSDTALLSILDEVKHRWPGIRTEKIFLMGFSGGGQFAHRFLYLYPERLEGVSVGAPGSVTMLDDGDVWPTGVGDVREVFAGREIDRDTIRGLGVRRRIQLVIGSEDDRVHGGEGFWEWLKVVKVVKGEEKGGKRMGFGGRLRALRELQRAWREEDGIEAELEVVEGVGHKSDGVRLYMLRFLGGLMGKEE